jgi:hypothetical protein
VPHLPRLTIVAVRQGKSELTMKRKFRYAGQLLATFSPTQPNMIVLAGAALGVGVYFFDFHIGQVTRCRRVRDVTHCTWV